MTPSRKLRLLVVDDTRYLLCSLKRLLANMADEWEMYFMDDPIAALVSMRETPVDVVVSDYQMPGMVGTELIRQVKALTPATVCIIMTGSGRHADLLEMDDVDGVIQKPCTPDELRRAITETCVGNGSSERTERVTR
jgi:two-component system, cell cycle sensor histidine kinase and response regulator CckA